MVRDLIVSDLADRDLRTAFAWSQEHYPADRERFRDEVSATLETLRQAPLQWALWHGPRIRRCLLPRLPYSVYYRVEAQTIFIEAFLHHRQDATARFPEDP